MPDTYTLTGSSGQIVFKLRATYAGQTPINIVFYNADDPNDVPCAVFPLDCGLTIDPPPQLEYQKRGHKPSQQVIEWRVFFNGKPYASVQAATVDNTYGYDHTQDIARFYNDPLQHNTILTAPFFGRFAIVRPTALLE